MTATLDRARPAHRRTAPPRTWLVTAALLAVALLLRAVGMRSANDLFIDEVTYADLAHQVALGHLPNEFGVPFFLHPPASFLLDALVIRTFGLTGDAMDLALSLRWVNAVLGAAAVVLVYLIARRLGGHRIALVAGLVPACDPFVLRYDTRLMIETPAMTAVLAGVLLLLGAQARPPSPGRVLHELAAGAVLGLALVTKDITAVATVLPVALAVLWRRTVPSDTAIRVLAASACPYLLYLMAIAAIGLFPQWWDAKIGGVLRVVGVHQTTGFNASPGAGLIDRLVELLTRFGTSYVLLGLGALAGIVAATSPVPARRLVGLVALCSGALGLYAVVGGAAEEQFGYYVVVSSVLALAACAADLVDRRPSVRRPVAAVAVVFLVTTAALGVTARLTVDDGYLQARAWLDAHVRPGQHVGLTNVTAEFALLPGHPAYGMWPSLRSLGAGDADYVLTQSHPLRNGYGYAAPGTLVWLERHATPVLDVEGPSNGDTVVWRVDRAAVDAAVTRGQSIPPVTGGFR